MQPVSRVNEEFSSHVWKSTSAWGPEELRLLHVDNIIVETVVDMEQIDQDDKRLSVLFKTLPYDTLEYDRLRRQDNDFENTMADTHGELATDFYNTMCSVISISNEAKEQESTLNFTFDQLDQYMRDIGWATPLTSEGRHLSEESSSAQVGSPPDRRKVAFEASHENSSTSLRSLEPARGIIRGISVNSVPSPVVNLSSDDSVSSTNMGTQEVVSELAIATLLKLILRVGRFNHVKHNPLHSQYHIHFNNGRGPVSINDGSIVVAPQLRDANLLPLINIECKSREGSTGLAKMSKVAAQEFGELLAIVQRRHKLSLWGAGSEPDLRKTVYSIGMQSRKAYLVRVDFNTRYLEGIACENLGNERVSVKRTQQAYRLDKKSELHDFVRMLYLLMQQLDLQVKNGRRF